MSDLVEREAVFDMLQNAYMGGNEFYDDLFELTEKLPTVEERKKGKWEDEKYREPLFDISGVKTWGVEFRCSECGFVHTVIEANGRYKFCPNCGADMRGEEDGE